MFRLGVVTRGRTAMLLSTRVVPANQPSAHDTTWFPEAGSTASTSSGASHINPERRAVESAYADVVKDLNRQKLKLDVEDSIKRNTIAGGASTFTKINLADDYLKAAEAKANAFAEEATASSAAATKVTSPDGTTVDVSTEEAAAAYVKRLDLSHMPNIPGVDKEELALKLLEFEKKKAQQVAQHLSGEAQRHSRVNQIEAMRMSMSPKDFKEFMESMEKAAEASEAELEKMRNMSPQELYIYQNKKRNVTFFKRIVDFCLFWGMASGATFMTYYLMFHHFAL